jgi:hypothetical protein
MNNKSYVGLEQHICPVCTKTHDVGVLLDRRLKNTLERNNVTGWGLCEEHKKQADEGYRFLVGCDESKSDLNNNHIKLENAYRTGEIVSIKSIVWNKIFNVPVPPKDKPIAFVGSDVIKLVSGMIEA